MNSEPRPSLSVETGPLHPNVTLFANLLRKVEITDDDGQAIQLDPALDVLPEQRDYTLAFKYRDNVTDEFTLVIMTLEESAKYCAEYMDGTQSEKSLLRMVDGMLQFGNVIVNAGPEAYGQARQRGLDLLAAKFGERG